MKRLTERERATAHFGAAVKEATREEYSFAGRHLRAAGLLEMAADAYESSGSSGASKVMWAGFLKDEARSVLAGIVRERRARTVL